METEPIPLLHIMPSHIGTISASIPFNYHNPQSHDCHTPMGTPPSVLPYYHHPSNNNSSNALSPSPNLDSDPVMFSVSPGSSSGRSSSFDSLKIAKDMIDMSHDNIQFKFKDKEITPNNVVLTHGENVNRKAVHLNLVSENEQLVPKVVSQTESATNIPLNILRTPVLSHTHVQLYRPSSLLALNQRDEDDSLSKLKAEKENLAPILDETKPAENVLSNKLSKSIKSKLNQIFLSSRSKSQSTPVLSSDLEDIAESGQQISNLKSCGSLIERGPLKQSKSEDKWKNMLRNIKDNQRTKDGSAELQATNNNSQISYPRTKSKSFASVIETGTMLANIVTSAPITNTIETEKEISNDINNTDSITIESDQTNKKRHSFFGDMIESNPRLLDGNDIDANDTHNSHGLTIELPHSVKVAKRPSLRGGQYCTLLQTFNTVLPPDQVAEMPLVIKDATDIFPLDSGETMVTDLLSDKTVLFDPHGNPKVTFGLEKGSEPWATHITPDGIMAVTLKGMSQVCLWSSRGEAMKDFGHADLAAPTGIFYDHLGRFVVTDQVNNTVSLFSREGEFLGELLNQDTVVKKKMKKDDNNSKSNGRCHQHIDKSRNERNNATHSNSQHSFNQPRYVCASRDGMYLISDSANHNVKIFDQDGVLQFVLGSYGREDGQFRFPYGVALDEQSHLVYVADHFNQRVSVFSSTSGTFLYHALTHEGDELSRPKGLAINGSKLYVTHGRLRAGTISVYNLHSHDS